MNQYLLANDFIMQNSKVNNTDNVYIVDVYFPPTSLHTRVLST
jgi:hypothetical protein